MSLHGPTLAHVHIGHRVVRFVDEPLPRHAAEMVSAGGHSSTTRTSSLYGGTANEVKNGKAGKKQQQQQEALWISED
ncbi:hypothetical protein niasHT_006278 [Heterodera trifolii]|uniref:Uncharacterized protein n=1 Tax=Heterodera trifolii TaxID=157864 RepID=A0ABD2M3H3_9BILA